MDSDIDSRVLVTPLKTDRVYKMRRTANIYAEESDKLIALAHIKSVLYTKTHCHLVYKDV